MLSSASGCTAPHLLTSVDFLPTQRRRVYVAQPFCWPDTFHSYASRRKWPVHGLWVLLHCSALGNAKPGKPPLQDTARLHSFRGKTSRAGWQCWPWVPPVDTKALLCSVFNLCHFKWWQTNWNGEKQNRGNAYAEFFKLKTLKKVLTVLHQHCQPC